MALLHAAIDGLLLVGLGPSMGAGESTDRAVRELVERLVQREKKPRALRAAKAKPARER